MSDEDPIVTVWSGGNAVELITVKLALDAEGIRYAVIGEGVQDLFGVGRMFGGFNHITGPIEVRVAGEDAARAREALEEADEGDVEIADS